MNAPVARTETNDWLIETSALVAIALREPDWRTFTDALTGAACKTCAFNVFEASLAVSSRRKLNVGEAHSTIVGLTQEFSIEVIPFTPDMLAYAVLARERFGRGRKGLNMGDCLSYAAAKQLGLKLLYKGDDFAATDVNG